MCTWGQVGAGALFAAVGCVKPERLGEAVDRGSAGRGEEGPGLPVELDGEGDPAGETKRSPATGRKPGRCEVWTPTVFPGG